MSIAAEHVPGGDPLPGSSEIPSRGCVMTTAPILSSSRPGQVRRVEATMALPSRAQRRCTLFGLPADIILSVSSELRAARVCSARAPMSPPPLWLDPALPSTRTSSLPWGAGGMRPDADEIQNSIQSLLRGPWRGVRWGGGDDGLVSSLQSGIWFSRGSFAWGRHLVLAFESELSHPRLLFHSHIGPHAGRCPLHEIDLAARVECAPDGPLHGQDAVQQCRWNVCPDKGSRA
jgi:hypothetical protein